MNFQIKNLKKHADKRGFLVEFLKGDELTESQKKIGQISLATIAPGEIRGNHYHKNKEEWFAVIAGKINILLEDINTCERKTFILDSSENSLKRVKVGPYTAHCFKNISNAVSILVEYATTIYDRKKPDQFAYEAVLR